MLRRTLIALPIGIALSVIAGHQSEMKPAAQLDDSREVDSSSPKAHSEMVARPAIQRGLRPPIEQASDAKVE